jgi:peptide/nickel transport system ATP-binding protein
MRTERAAISAMRTNLATSARLLKVDDLRVRFYTRDGVVRAVNGISFDLNPSETVGIVGESGCGKSVMSLAIMGLIPQPPGKIESGRILLEDRNLLQLSEGSMRRVRGNEISMIFQEPMTSLNPVMTVGFQIAESLMLHQKLSKKKAFKQAVAALEMVRIPDPDRRVGEFPHQMSGGMRQRVMIAMALSCNPKVLIADEPTTALDVTIQAQILNLMRQLREKTRAAIIMITHDLGVIAETAGRVVVMYAGYKVEEAPVRILFAQSLHPYTRGLIASVPRIDAPEADELARQRLNEIPGMVPSLRSEIIGCPFASRCDFVRDRCRQISPQLGETSPGHIVACWETDSVRTAFNV